MDFFPVFLNIKNQECLVVGGGDVAARKVRSLLASGAHVRVVAPELGKALHGMADKGEIAWRSGRFQAEDIRNCVLVVAATNDQEINEQVSTLAKQQRLPVNVVDQPDLCTFIMPSVIDRSPVMVAVSSGASSPVLARLLRAKLETVIPGSYGRLASLVKDFRQKAKQHFPATEQRRRFWEHVLQGPIAEMIFSGQDDRARNALKDSLEKGEAKIDLTGEVYLVGAGPGDPDLLTFRALRLLQQADVIVYDRLVSKPILNLARRDADMIYVGKEKSRHTMQQEDINHLLVRLAKEGKKVLRLKGGDPFIFGRGGEEIDTLMDEGIAFQVVPGVTAASGCAAYAGIPLTHRDYAQSVVFATGHLKDHTIDLNWKALIQPHQTIVFYMGLTGIHVICQELIRHGMAAETPIALVQRGTTPQQKVYYGTLTSMPHIAEQTAIKPPTLIIVGDVVKLHEKLAWFHPVDESTST